MPCWILSRQNSGNITNVAVCYAACLHGAHQACVRSHKTLPSPCLQPCLCSSPQGCKEILCEAASVRNLDVRSGYDISAVLHRQVALSAHEAWAHWAAGALGAQLLSAMQGDPALVSHIPLRNWAETVISHVSMQPEAACVVLLTCQAKSGAHVMSCNVMYVDLWGRKWENVSAEVGCVTPFLMDTTQEWILQVSHPLIFSMAQEDELGGPAEEMRFALPAAPSAPAQAFLLAGAREVARAGGCYLSTDALALFIWRLGDAALAAIRWECRSLHCMM